jgi:signal transduction histidine kinase
MVATAVQALGNRPAAFEAVIDGPDGPRQLSFRCRALELDGRALVLSLVHDVTAAREADRRRAEFVGTIAHDLRNPLSVILGYAEMLREMDGDAERGEMLGRLVANARAAIALVANYADLQRIELGRLAVESRRTDLTLPLDAVADLYREEAQRRQIGFELDAGSDVPAVLADAGALERALGNLLHNAVRHTPAGGRVALRVNVLPRVVEIDVCDTGPGLAAEELPTLFQRGHGRGKGKRTTGIGLFVARALIEAQEGTLAVAHGRDGGCISTVALRRA